MQGFDAANPPFDRLTHEEVEGLRAVLDIGYFSPDEVIVRQEHASDLLHVIIKGAVEVRDGDALQSVLGAAALVYAQAPPHAQIHVEAQAQCVHAPIPMLNTIRVLRVARWCCRA